jgi:hypothetical protein
LELVALERIFSLAHWHGSGKGAAMKRGIPWIESDQTDIGMQFEQG